MTVGRGGRRETLKLRVGEVPAEATAAAGGAAPAKEEDERLGVALRELMPSERNAAGVDYGLLVVDVAQRSGPGSAILPGDIILGVNQSRITSRRELERLLAAHRKGDMVALFVRRGDASLYVPVELGG
jgi:serine protease Do